MADQRRPPARRPLFVGRPSVLAASRRPNPAAQPRSTPAASTSSQSPRPTPTPSAISPSVSVLARPSASRSSRVSTSRGSTRSRSLFETVAAPSPPRPPRPKPRPKPAAAPTSTQYDSDEEPTLSGVRQVLLTPSRRRSNSNESPRKRQKRSESTATDAESETEHDVYVRPPPPSELRQQEIGQLGGPSSVINSVMSFGKYKGKLPDFAAPPPPPPPPADQKPEVNEEEPLEEVQQGSSDETSQQGALVHAPRRPPRPEPLPGSVAPTSSWPPHFVRLEQTFRAVTVVSSFVSAHKHIVLSYHLLRTSVERLLKRPLEIIELAQIKSLCPDMVDFAYSKMEEVASHLTETDHEGRRAETREVDDAYALAASSSQDHFADGREIPEEANENGYILLFAFKDGEQSAPKATSSGKFSKFDKFRKQAAFKAAQGDGKFLRGTPKDRSAKETQQLIKKRNEKFSNAIRELLAACEGEGKDNPEQLLLDAAADHVPVHPSLGQERSEAMSHRDRKAWLNRLLLHPEERPSVGDMITELTQAEDYQDQIVPGGLKAVPARESKFGMPETPLSEDVQDLLAESGINQLYTHQAHALDAYSEGMHVVVATPTSSGKSLIYQLPLLDSLAQGVTAFFIFPTKALAQDQLRSLSDLLRRHPGIEGEPPVVGTYDGDTPTEERKYLRKHAQVIFTNVDMLHQGILPGEEQWRPFLTKLRLVVLDELHVYDGLFGAHAALVFRRLRRICSALGNDLIQFISSSATISDPAAHMSNLLALPPDTVAPILGDMDGSPQAEKHWVFWNPPMLDESDPKQGRVSSYTEATKIFIHLMERGARTILFTRVRRQAEILLRQVRETLLLCDRSDLVDKVAAYRGGYSASDRRNIEQAMFTGDLLGIISTTALELGIDVGHLDAIIMHGFPYSIASLRQMAGRAGRRQGKDSAAILVAEAFPLDQHYMRSPHLLFEAPATPMHIQYDNDFLLECHIQCAAYEMPVQPDEDEGFFGPQIRRLAETRLVKGTGDRAGFYFPADGWMDNPSGQVPLRGGGEPKYTYVEVGLARVLEEVEMTRSIFEAFEGAVFMHQGQPYLCVHVDHDKRIAHMTKSDVHYHTRSRDHTDIDAVETQRVRSLSTLSEGRAYYGAVKIESRVWGYYKVDRQAHILDSIEVETPPYVRHSRGMWIDVPTWLLEALVERGINVAAAIHSAEHALLSLTPLFSLASAGDVLTDCKLPEREFGTSAPTARRRPARLLWYDAQMVSQHSRSQKGAGLCHKAFEHLEALLTIATMVIEQCPCVEGCMGCIHSANCAHGNLVFSKVGALAVLRAIRGLEPFDEQLEYQGEQGRAASYLGDAALSQTVRPATPVPSQPNVQVETFQEALPSNLPIPSQRPQSPVAPPGASMVYEEEVESNEGQDGTDDEAGHQEAASVNT